MAGVEQTLVVGVVRQIELHAVGVDAPADRLTELLPADVDLPCLHHLVGAEPVQMREGDFPHQLIESFLRLEATGLDVAEVIENILACRLLLFGQVGHRGVRIGGDLHPSWRRCRTSPQAPAKRSLRAACGTASRRCGACCESLGSCHAVPCGCDAAACCFSSLSRLVTRSSSARQTTRIVSTACFAHGKPISWAGPAGSSCERSARCTMSLRRFTVASRVFLISSSSRPSCWAIRLPRIVQRKQHAGDVDASSAAEVAEVQAANHLVGNEQRVGINQNANGFIKIEFQVLELVLERFVVPWDEISSSKSNHFGQVVPQQDWEVRFQSSAGGNNGLSQQIAQGTAFDC